MKHRRDSAAKKFAHWTKKNFPELYQAAILRMGKNGLGATIDGEEETGFWSNLLTSVKDLAPAYLQFNQQKKLMKMQLERAKAGLPPANVADYAPVIRTQIDLAPATRNAVIGSMQNMLMPIAIGGGILLLVLAMKKRR